jgi:predicted phosphodiesterase
MQKKKMKVSVVSDLHLEMCDRGEGVPELGQGDVLILGGDILCVRHFKKNGKLKLVYSNFLKKCVSNFDKVLYVSGNHEAYGYNYEGIWKAFKEYFPTKIQVLENDFVKIGDWVFLGCSLWTDFRGGNPLEMMEASQCMNDYKVIRITSKYRKMTPDDTYNFHKKSKMFLMEKLEQFKNENVWVMTHHGPSYQSIHEKYKRGGISNGAFVSDLDNFILQHPQIKYWSHGHTHNSFDYMIGDCRVICNPRGYYTGVNSNDLNFNFDSRFSIEV